MEECLSIKTYAPGLCGGYGIFLLKTAFRKMAAFIGEKHGKKQAVRSEDGVNQAEVNRQAERILDTYGNSILRYAYSYLHNMSDAEEILQDTLFQFMKTAPSFESSQHEKAWLLRVAANLSKNRVEYNAIRKTDELNDELMAECREDLSFVWDAVKKLPAKYREVIHLFYYEGYSTEQIAEILNMKGTTVRSHLNRGRAKLKAMLQEEYDFEEKV